MQDSAPRASRPLLRAGIWIGVALAAFLDGIVLHQVLQWHHMVSSVYEPSTHAHLRINTLADGLFHVAAYVFAVVGLVQLWRARQAFGAERWARGFVGAVLVGAGAFNLVEGVVNHHILGIHHVREGSPNRLAWDLGFMAISAAILGLGLWMRRTAREG
ncbi:MAG TPA: DUF2243 domain-containing protein [Acetobacteraceae bacterium]|nr:DUF2243 domain-containing protein [Acetobacteraceae bacterium]